MEVVTDIENMMCNIKVDIAIRKKYVSDCSSNLELLTFNILTSDTKSNFVSINLEDDLDLFKNNTNDI